MKLEDIIDSLLGKKIFIVSVNQDSHQDLVRLIVDSEYHVCLDETTEIAKRIRASKDIQSMFPNGVRIEVSTPGIAAPLEHDYQFKKNIGRKLNISLQGELDKNILGVLKDVKENGIHITSNDKKIQFYSFNDICKATVQVSF
tara:strand:+ start:398 stop:826 length:429 start_codon:yes stop_codon:yes gene_type:complete